MELHGSAFQVERPNLPRHERDKNVHHKELGDPLPGQSKTIHSHRRWEEFGSHLGVVIKTILYTYDPEAIILGGSLTKAHQFFKARMLDSLKDFAYPESIKRLSLLLSENENIALLGAAALMDQ